MKQVFTIILLIAATAGSIFFFPAHYSGNHVCLYEKVDCKCGPQAACRQSMVEAVHNHHDVNHSDHHKMTTLIQRYLLPFGIIWWSSVLVLVLSIMGLRRMNMRKRLKSNMVEFAPEELGRT